MQTTIRGVCRFQPLALTHPSPLMHTTLLSRLSTSLIFFVSAASAWASPPTLLYDGSAAPELQNWQVMNRSTPFTVIVGSGAEAGTTRFTTSTSSGGSTSGVNLYRYTESATNFIVSIRLKVNSVSPHNQLDAGLMFNVSNTFPAPFGTGTNRSEMLYIDPASVGWGDDSQSAPLNHIGAFHEYAIRYQSGQLTLYVDADYAAIADGTATGILSKTVANPITTSAHFIFGDQTNDANVDGDFVVDYVKFQNLDLPDPPASISATGGNSSVSATFTPPANNGSSTISSYLVTATDPGNVPAGSCTPSPALPTGSQTATCTITGLANGVTYTLSARAVNASGAGPAATATAQPLAQPLTTTAIPTLEPTNLAALTGILSAAAAGLYRRRRRDFSKTGN